MNLETNNKIVILRIKIYMNEVGNGIISNIALKTINARKEEEYYYPLNHESKLLFNYTVSSTDKLLSLKDSDNDHILFAIPNNLKKITLYTRINNEIFRGEVDVAKISPENGTLISLDIPIQPCTDTSY